MLDSSVHYIVVMLHRFKGFHSEKTISKEYCPLKHLIKELYGECTLLFPKIPFGFFTSGSIVPHLNGWLQEIDLKYEHALKAHPGKTIKLVFIGHSLGGLIARKLYVIACGNNLEAPLEEGIAHGATPRPWAIQVERLVLLAGMNNGWNIDYHSGVARVLRLTLGLIIGNTLSYFHRKPILLTIRKGGSYITQLRLQTLAMLAKAQPGGLGSAVTVQLLGTIDDLVSPQDDIDDVGGVSFVYREVAFSGHSNIIALDDKLQVVSEGQPTTAGAVRKKALTEALLHDRSVLEKNSYNIPAFKNIIVDKDILHVVFVVHGIRDEGFWTLKIGNRILKAAAERLPKDPTGKSIYAIETASYGYFPLLQFALPGYRNGKVAWFMDRYAANKIRYPNAEFSFVGHSNGTFLIARALQEYPACTFRNVLFAGSVINRDFDWNYYLQQGRVAAVHNIAATSDAVVGIFPQAMHAVFRDLGAAGYFGFNNLLEEQQTITIPGGHGAGVTEQYWDAIASFIVTGAFHPPIVKDPAARKIVFTPWLAGILFILGFILFFILVPYCILTCIGNGELKITVLVLYIFILWKFLTRF